jgi:hypothetical protein
MSEGLTYEKRLHKKQPPLYIFYSLPYQDGANEMTWDTMSKEPKKL